MRSNRTCLAAIKKQHLWVITEAVAEARSRHHLHLVAAWEPLLASKIGENSPPWAIRQEMVEYLFKIPTEHIPVDPWDRWIATGRLTLSGTG